MAIVEVGDDLDLCVDVNDLGGRTVIPIWQFSDLKSLLTMVNGNVVYADGPFEYLER